MNLRGEKRGPRPRIRMGGWRWRREGGEHGARGAVVMRVMLVFGPTLTVLFVFFFSRFRFSAPLSPSLVLSRPLTQHVPAHDACTHTHRLRLVRLCSRARACVVLLVGGCCPQQSEQQLRRECAGCRQLAQGPACQDESKRSTQGGVAGRDDDDAQCRLRLGAQQGRTRVLWLSHSSSISPLAPHPIHAVCQ